MLRIINEPTAASLAYGLDKKKDEKIAVYDLGGGTFDISVLDIGDGVFEVRATNGDTHLGGDDWDNKIIDWVIKEFKTDTGIDLSKQVDAIQRIKEEAEKAKIALSSTQSYDINLPFITADQTGPKHIQKTLTRSKLEQLTDDLFARTVKPVKDCLRDSEVPADKIDELVLVGGMTRMPKVVETARSIVNKEPHKGVNPDEVVAIGAAIQGGVLKGDVKDVLLLDVIPADAGHRNGWRRGDPDDPAQHDGAHAQVADFLDLQRQPARRGDQGSPGRASALPRQQEPRDVPPRRHPAVAPWHAADRGHVRHRRERHPQRLGQGPRHRQGAENLHHRFQRSDQGRDRAHAQGSRSARRRGQQGQGVHRDPQPGRQPRLPVREAAQGPR